MNAPTIAISNSQSIDLCNCSVSSNTKLRYSISHVKVPSFSGLYRGRRSQGEFGAVLIRPNAGTWQDSRIPDGKQYCGPYENDCTLFFTCPKS